MKKTLSIILSFVLVIASIPITVNAYSSEIPEAPYIAPDLNIIVSEAQAGPDLSKAVSYYKSIPDNARITIGEARNHYWTTTSNGLLEKDSASGNTLSAIKTIVLYFISTVSETAGNIISAVQAFTGVAGNPNKPCNAKAMISYQYFYNDGEVYTSSGWLMFYRTARRYTYKHAWATYNDMGGTLKQGVKDYTPTYGYGPIETYTSPYYTNDNYVKNTARDRYVAGLDSYSECPW